MLKFLNIICRTQIEGLDIHFLHVKPKTTSGKKVVSLLLVHGWPGSVVEFDEILPTLTSPQHGSDVVFEVICPSLPGFGFSQGAAKMGKSWKCQETNPSGNSGINNFYIDFSKGCGDFFCLDILYFKCNTLIK